MTTHADQLRRSLATRFQTQAVNETRCDFCSDPHPLDRLHHYPAADYTLRCYLKDGALWVVPCLCHVSTDEFAGCEVVYSQNMVEGWGACDACAAFIDANDREGLKQRAKDRARARGIAEESVAGFTVTHDGYWFHRPGGAGTLLPTKLGRATPAPAQSPWEAAPIPPQTSAAIARYSVALEQQLDLLQFYTSEAGRTAMQTAVQDPFAAARHQSAIITSLLTKATPIFVSRQIAAGLDEAAGTFPDVPLLPSMLPTPSGFAYLDGPGFQFFSPSGQGLIGTVRGVGWMTATEEKAEGGTDSVVVIAGFGTHVDPRRLNSADPLWQLLTTDVWRVSDLLSHPAEGGRAALPDWYSARRREVRRFTASLWAFMQQPIVRISRERPDRPLRRRLDRHGYTHEKLIDVIELRARQYTGQTEADHPGVEWSCRWVVRGHWRKQWYPSKSTHEPVWIMPYDKGPKDAPLKNAAKLFAVIR